MTGIKMAKHRPWLRDIRRDLFHLVEMGVATKILRDHDDPVRNSEKEVNLRPFGMEHLASAFIAFSVLVIVATIVFGFERVKNGFKDMAK